MSSVDIGMETITKSRQNPYWTGIKIVSEVIDLKGKCINLIVAVVLAWIVPSVILSFYKKEDIGTEERQAETVCVTTQTQTSTQDIRVLMDDGSVEQMDLETYVTCVVLREMPVEFEVEALKAQAVVARTYTLRRCRNNTKHNNADVCVNPACCQGFYKKESYIQDGGTEILVRKVEDAVNATKSQVLIYEGDLIDATYFSCSGGRTEDALAVWGADIPYLQSTDSPGEENALRYTDTVTFSVKEFSQLLDLNPTVITEQFVSNISYTRGGGVDQITIGMKNFKGTELRQKLGIRSTAFTISITGDTITVTTKGFGHRVGMSQYGADAMALSGSNYKEILDHYYKDVTLTEYSSD